MSTLGKQIRLSRIFRHSCGRILSVAVDHMINYPVGMPDGLKHVERTVEQVVEGRPSSITLNKGVAMRCMERFAGRIPLIVQQMALTPPRQGFADHASVEEVVAMGADAIAVAIFVKDPGELAYLKHLATTVREAERFGLPVIPHIYPIVLKDGKPTISYAPEDVFYAVRAGLEMGADVIKAPYTGDPASYADIVSCTPVPVVTAGGPQCDTVDDAVAMLRDVVKSGAAGTTIGRNVWGFPDIVGTIRKFKEALGIED